MEDKLDKMFFQQDQLNRSFGINAQEMSDIEREKRILDFTRAMQQELAELTDCTPWKWWAKYQAFDVQNARVEVVDLMHFLISLAQLVGMTADDLFDVYQQKMRVNIARKNKGYLVKDENDCKDIKISER